MTRIVAGTAGGRRLKVPPSKTRPTSGRVREALFSSLEHRGRVEGRRVLDLYAGSGALGLEAASRGAAYVECVEAVRSSAQTIRLNARLLGLDVTVSPMRVRAWLGRASRRPFDLAILDPPYDMSETELADALCLLGAHLAADGLVVVERSARSPEPSWPSDMAPTGQRALGDTRLWTATPVRLET